MTRLVRSRRTHHKSRSGCSNCKRRRIKCDEKKPICTNCANHEVECTFSARESSELSSAASGSLSPSERRPQEKKYRFRTSQYTTEISNRTAQSPALKTTEMPYKDVSTEASMESISMVDLQLFHHFLVSTIPTTVDDDHGRAVWQNHVVQWAFEFPSIMHLLLALSALHMGHGKPALRVQYLQQADDHFTFGVQSVTAVLSELNADTCQKVYISAVMICFAYFGRGPRPGEYLVFSDNGPAEWLVLMHGVKLILESHRKKVFSGVLEPKPSSDIPNMSPSMQNEMQEYTAQVQGLQRLVDIQHSWDAGDRVMYVSAIDNLTSTLEEVYQKRSLHKPAVGLMHILIGWLYRLPRDFVAELERKNPLALVILAHWAGLLKYMESVWFMRGWGEHVLNGVCAFLPADLLGWIEWPMERVQKE
ncbi:Zn(II)2Cys6 transcription factor domain-containing protein [Aspergillus ruber CBS 135680]|uniref:Zn(2)-C6 fungal-type domain-containing protein n=1 Tax=Aspergillus ruber (strain CBS 135680) TaxID=1388766 RepID=A0A017RZ03_ASPRC|nr:uncharacterized protein EURHEDRAFT_468215 [Aspergillus ruber CBS 135680]EYE89998.1 hypothetical protein EURHEDRAFT_468215 [Aspergillus ruber CBS 135680]